MNKDIRKYIANCTLCHREKAKVQAYPLEMMEILECPFDKITIDLVTECKTFTSGNKHILTIIDHLTSWPEAFPIPDKSSDTLVSPFIYQFTCNLDTSFQTMNLKIISWTKFFNNCIFPHHTILRALRSWKSSPNIWNLPSKIYLKRIQPIGTSTLIKFLLATEYHPISPQQNHHIFSSMVEIQTYH